jgi:uncharacterized protein YceH (UPF0502 family)
MEKLRPIEARLIGAMIEKAFTTPDQYPLSLNALLGACNQRSNRDPVMSLTENDVLDTLQSLRAEGWVTVVMPSSGRVERYRHHVRDKLELDGRQQAVIAELLLRGAQTGGELRTRCARMKPFESLEIMHNVLASLAGREQGPLVRKLPPAPGGRAERWAQTLYPRADDDAPPPPTQQHPARSEAAPASGNQRIETLERRIAALEQRLERLERRINS